jgi:hypothetical protein
MPAAQLAHIKGGYMDNQANIAEIFTPERKTVLLDILLATGSTSVTIMVSKPHPARPEDILAKPTLDSIQIALSYSTI